MGKNSKTDNELIAEFMGWKRAGESEDGVFHKGQWFHTVTYENMAQSKDIPYATSWDWLMLVVEKIHLLREVKQVSISPGKTRIWFADHLAIGYIESPCKPENSSIIECYLAVVEFIKWYNKNKQP